MATNNAVNVGLSGSTGTGNFVGSTAPTLVTPKMATIYDPTQNLEIFQISGVVSGVNFLDVTNAVAGNPPALSAVGNDSNIDLLLQSKGTSGVRLKGRANATGVAAGSVGQVISSTVTFESSTAYTSGNTSNLTSISLTAGDWDVWGNAGLSAVAISAFTISISTVSATSAANDKLIYISATLGGVYLNNAFPIVINVSSTTTVYLVINGNTTGTTIMFGNLFARRRS